MIKLPKPSTKGISIGLVIIMIQLLLLLWSDFIFGAQSSMIRNVLVVYFLMEVLVLASYGLTMPGIKAGLSEVIFFLIFFGLTAAIVIFIPKGIMGAFDIISTGFTLGLIGYVFVKAFIEEIVFRQVLGDRIGGVAQAGVFGVFHFAILWLRPAATLPTVLFGTFFLAMMGYLWFLIYKRFGILASTGSHVAWNLSAVGILGMLLGV